MNELQQLQADLEWAASQGAEHAAREAVDAGVSHEESPLRALGQVESVHTQWAGPDSASVTASQPWGISPGGPQLPSPSGAADVMAHVAADAGQRAIGGHK